MHTHTHPFFFRFFSHTDYHRMLGRVLCAIQQVFVGQSLHIPQWAYASSNPLIHPSPQPVPFGNHKFVFKVYESVSNELTICTISVCFFYFNGVERQGGPEVWWAMRGKERKRLPPFTAKTLCQTAHMPYRKQHMDSGAMRHIISHF